MFLFRTSHAHDQHLAKLGGRGDPNLERDAYYIL